MKLLLLFLSFVLSSTLNGLIAQRHPGMYRNELKTSITQPLSILLPAVELSYERYYRKNLSSALTIGKVINHPIPDAQDFRNMKGFELGVETKWFEKANEQSRKRRYIAAELIYINQQYNATNSFTDTPWPDDNPYFDSIGVKRYSIGLSGKAGFKVRFGHFMMDLSGGLGLRYVDSKHTNKINPDSEEVNSRHPNIWSAFAKEGKRVGVALPLAFKIGYTF